MLQKSKNSTNNRGELICSRRVRTLLITGGELICSRRVRTLLITGVNSYAPEE